MADGDLRLDRLDHAIVDRVDAREIHRFDAELASQDTCEIRLRDEPHSHDVIAEPEAVAPLLGQSGFELLFGE